MLQSSLPPDVEGERLFDALGSPVRRQILRDLGSAALSVGELSASFSISRPAISRHLAVLEEAGLVQHIAEGTRNVYRLNTAGFERTSQWLAQFWDDAEARLRLVAENLPRPTP